MESRPNTRVISVTWLNKGPARRLTLSKMWLTPDMCCAIFNDASQCTNKSEVILIILVTGWCVDCFWHCSAATTARKWPPKILLLWTKPSTFACGCISLKNVRAWADPLESAAFRWHLTIAAFCFSFKSV